MNYFRYKQFNKNIITVAIEFKNIHLFCIKFGRKNIKNLQYFRLFLDNLILLLRFFMSKISFTLKLGYKLFNIKSIRIKTKSSYLYSIKTRRNSFQKPKWWAELGTPFNLFKTRTINLTNTKETNCCR